MTIMKNKKLILASSSIYRRQLLKRIVDDFESIAPDIDETPFPDEEPIELVARLAEQKALTVAIDHPDSIIIASDQICVIDKTILGKPLSKENAIAQLSAYSGKSVYFYTSLCIVNDQLEPNNVTVVTTKVKFKQLSLHQITRYIEREMPLDCAGSFKCEGLGIALFDSIESKDPTALIGLPLISLTKQLAAIGYDILD